MMVNTTMIIMVMMGPQHLQQNTWYSRGEGEGGYRLPPTNHKLTRNIWKSDKTISNYIEVDFEKKIK